MKKTQLVTLIGCALSIFSCSKQDIDKIIGKTTADGVSHYLENLKAYKASPHPLMAGYFNKLEETGDQKFSNLGNIPDSVDIVDIFTNMHRSNEKLWAKKEAIKKDIALLQEKGTKVVNGFWMTDYTRYKHADGTPLGDNEKDYAFFADSIYFYCAEWGLDGIDIDMEPDIIYPKAKTIGILNALSKRFGPQSRNKNLFIFDTDQRSGSPIYNIFNETKTNYDYVFFQAYNCSGDAWYGDSAVLTATMNSYTKNFDKKKFLAFTNGQKTCAWDISNFSGGSRAQIVEYADWAVKNKAGGIGVYGINYDYNNNNYQNVKAAIKLMNP
ncbi:glycoside hydrolase family 18 [Chitinophaga sp.]|uniref:glycoside hydrolase family 18 n=1 Tax=Chitinophaga sp. TaxID=1869181 RepID=UPI002F926055